MSIKVLIRCNIVITNIKYYFYIPIYIFILSVQLALRITHISFICFQPLNTKTKI